jgi:hypothetical protein
MSPLSCWLQNSLGRVFPSSPPGGVQTVRLLAGRNERISFQACVHNPMPSAISAHIAVDDAQDLAIVVRRVGYVPVAHFNTGTEQDQLEGVGHIPGYVPDPLFPEQSALIGPFENQSFWITVAVPADAQPGLRTLDVRLTVENETVGQMQANIHISPLVVQPPKDFPVTHWFYTDALCDWYRVEPFEERLWELLQRYMRNLVEHGNNCMFVPLFTPPTDGVKRPTQLLGVSEPAPGQYRFDFGAVKRWTDLASGCGARYLEWTHLFSQWGIKHALRIYRSNQDAQSLLWPPETGATSDVYRNFLAQFLPAFYRFLQAEGLLERSFFHLSDEPHGEEHLRAYRAARELLRELAPWMKVMDALSEIEFAQQGLMDIPIPSIRTARQFIQAGIPSWAYFCGGPRGKYLQREMDTPLYKIRMSGWLFYRLAAQGFLHWGYNYWYERQTQTLIDPFREQSGAAWPRWSYGDTFVVYPGPDGPLDSIRWEVFAESMQDYGLLQSAGVSPEDGLLAGIQDYTDCQSAAWVLAARQRLLGA